MSTVKRLLTNPWTMAAIILAAAVLWMLSGLLHADPEMPPPATATAALRNAGPTEVQVRRLFAEPVTRQIEVNGRTAPARRVQLKAETSGRVVAVTAERGARINQGEILLRLDERDRGARLEAARATLRQRELENDAARRLGPNGYVTEAQVAETAAALEIARTELRRAELDLTYSVIRAPFDGALEERTVEIGDYVAAGDPVAEIVDDRRLIVTGTVPEQEVASLRVGQPAEARLVTGQRVNGVLRYISPVADIATRTFTVELVLDNADGRLPAGVTAELRIPAGTVMAHRISPALLTLDDDGRLGIKLVDENGAVKFAAIETVRSDPTGVWIAGLPEEAAVITVGQGFVRDGDPVAVFAENLPAGSGAVVAESAQP